MSKNGSKCNTPLSPPLKKKTLGKGWHKSGDRGPTLYVQNNEKEERKNIDK